MNLRDAEAGDPALTGGKAARLSRLAHAGMTVPDAFVVTTAAFAEHFPVPPAPPPEAPAAQVPAAQGQAPQAPPLMPQLCRAIDGALRTTFPDQPFLAVRSSAVGEDGAAASFAGQHDTYYYIPAHGVADAVAACWMSLWSPAARAYRARRPHVPEPAMAVIVQRMIQADRAGVCFTDDPTGRHPGQAWIEAIWGLGAALVDGRVSPDRLLLDRDGRVVFRQIGRKRHKVAQSLLDPTDARLEPVPASQQTRSVLSDGEAAGILRLSIEAEGLFGGPQDVEWAFRDNALYLLQSRPISAASRAGDASGAAPVPDLPGRWVLFKPLAENFTEPLTPMTADLFRRLLPPVGRFVNGHFYLSLDFAERVCPFRWQTADLVDALLLRGEVPPLTLRPWKAPLIAAGMAMLYLLDGISWHRTARLGRRGLEAYATLCERVLASPRHDAPAALHRLVVGGHPFESIGRRAYYVNVSAGRYFFLLGALTKLMARYAPDVDPRVIQGLCAGDGDTFSRRMVENVRSLAAVARRDPDLARRLTAADPEALAGTLAQLPATHPFAQALQGFLRRFGHRCMREMELATPRWREDPLPVLLMVRSHLKSAGGAPPDTHADLLAARDTVRRALPRRWQQRLADYLIRRIRYYVSLREDTRHYHAMAMAVARVKLLDLEQQLLAAGRLRLAGDVFYLTWAEAQALAAGDLRWPDVSERIRRRRQQRLEAARAGAPDTIGLPATPAATPTADGAARAGACLNGQCASPGSAEGRARIVLDPATAHDIEPGDILVAPYTDPGWTPLFPLVAAVVVEVGSFLSHAGTVAREYGVPCLVDVDGCVRSLRDGQRIRVLASEGRIEICDS